MKHNELLLKALLTLFYSWGGDTPTEVYWGANELLVWFEAEFEVELGIRFEIDPITNESNYDNVIEKIKNI